MAWDEGRGDDQRRDVREAARRGMVLERGQVR